MKTLSWDKIQQGDEEAFRQLYEQYADLLYGYGMKIAGDETLVTEAIQSLFVYIFEKRETCTAPQSIPAYLCVSLRHMIVNELKKENSGSLKSLDEVGTNEYQFDLEIDIETAIIHSELEKEQLEDWFDNEKMRTILHQTPVMLRRHAEYEQQSLFG